LVSFNEFAEQWNPAICKKNYGSIMIDSSLADWIEFLALSKQSVPWNTIIDYLKKDQNSLFMYRPPMIGPDLDEWNYAIPDEGDDDGDDHTDYEEESSSSNTVSKSDFHHETEELEEEANREASTLEESIRNLINARGQYLKNLYPFTFEQNVLQLKKRCCF